MSVSKLHTLGPVVLDTTVIPGIKSLALNTGNEVRVDHASSEPYPRWAAHVAQRPGFSFSTLALKRVLDIVTWPGISIAGLGAKASIYSSKYGEGGIVSSSSVHRKFVAQEGIIVPRRLSCEFGGDAVLTLDALVTSDGTNNAFVITDTMALPTLVDDDSRWTLGPAKLANISFGQLVGLDFDFGIDAAAEGSDSDICPTFGYIRQCRPSLTLRGTDVTMLETTSGGSALDFDADIGTSANSCFYLRKRTRGAGYVVDGTAAHLKISMAGVSTVQTPIDARSNERGMITVRFDPMWDGTNALVKIETAIAIT